MKIKIAGIFQTTSKFSAGLWQSLFLFNLSVKYWKVWETKIFLIIKYLGFLSQEKRPKMGKVLKLPFCSIKFLNFALDTIRWFKRMLVVQVKLSNLYDLNFLIIDVIFMQKKQEK